MYHAETHENGDNENATLNRYFHENVQLASDEAKKYRDIAFPNVEKILTYVNKQDPRFSKEPVRAGSYWQGLKVERADEFDYSVLLEGIGNLVWGSGGQRYYGFNKPKAQDSDPDDLQVVRSTVPLPSPPPGYVYVRLSGAVEEQYRDLMFEGDLIPYNVRHALKKLLQTAKRDLNLRGEVQQSRKTHGPALTMSFKVRSREMGIDFAPMIRAHLPFHASIKWPRAGARWPDSTKIERIKGMGINAVAKKDFWWLLSFVEAEKELVAGVDIDGGKRKQLHRTMKKMNGDVWCNTSKPVISSYILKNIWFWEMERYPSVRDWDNDHLWIRFESMTRNLLDCIQKRFLQQYFHPDINLMANKKQDDLDIVQNKIRAFLQNPMPYFEIDN